MACPYCGSGDWEETEEVIDIRLIDHTSINADFLCVCRSCGRNFKTTNLYKTEEYDYECSRLDAEELEEYGEFDSSYRPA